jgi:hypothetical protein
MTPIPSVATVLGAALRPLLDEPPAVEVGVLAAVETALGSVAKILTLASSK